MGNARLFYYIVMSTTLEQRIENIISPSVESLGYALVRVKLLEGAPRTLQIMAERTSDKQLNIDDCEKISRTVSALLDVEDPITEEYNLEVSSPGIDRPLVKPEDFERYAGFDVKLSTHTPINNRKRFKGILLGYQTDANSIAMKLNDTGEEVTLSLDDIDNAKLVITDKLLTMNTYEVV